MYAVFVPPRCAKPPPMRSPCPIANTLDLLGDRWSLLVVRDAMFFGKRRFGEFARSTDGIPTNILADRLRRLEESGILERIPYRKRPPRYEYRLTRKGKELFPVLREMALWAGRHIPGAAKAPPGFLERAAASIAGDAAARAPRARRSSLKPR